MQQQLKCLEERVKLVEFKVDTAISVIGDVVVAIDRNYMRLNEVLDSSLNSQQNFDGLSVQLRDIQDFLQKESSNHVASKSKTDAEVESPRKATAITEQAQTLKSKKKGPEPEFGYESERMSESSDEHEVKKIEKAEKKQRSSSSSSSYVSSDGFVMPKKTPGMKAVKNPVKKRVDVQISSAESTISEISEKSASKIRAKKITAFNQAGQDAEKITQSKQVSSTLSPITQEPAKHRPSPIVQEPAKIFVQEPAKGVHEEPIAIPLKNPTTKSVQKDSIKRIYFKDIDFCEWKPTTKKIDPLGQGKLDFQASKRKIFVKFTSYDTFNYWMKAGAKWKNMGGRHNSVMFHCREDPEGNGPVKMMLATFSNSSTANSLIRFFEENCEK